MLQVERLTAAVCVCEYVGENTRYLMKIDECKGGAAQANVR